MMPGIDPRQMKQMMKQMGMTSDELSVNKITIECEDKTLVFENNPQVTKVVMKGQATLQVSGSYTEQEKVLQISISNDDIDLVSSQANVSKDKAELELKNTKGDIAQAISNLTCEASD